MYAVFESGGLQFNGEEGSLLKVPYFSSKPGEMISIEKVFLVKVGDNSFTGKPYLATSRVAADVA